MTKSSQKKIQQLLDSVSHNIPVERFLRKSFYVGRKIHVARLLQVDRIIGFYQKTEFCGLHFSKNFQIFTEVRIFVLLHFVTQAQLILKQLARSKIWDFLLYLLVGLHLTAFQYGDLILRQKQTFLKTFLLKMI